MSKNKVYNLNDNAQSQFKVGVGGRDDITWFNCQMLFNQYVTTSTGEAPMWAGTAASVQAHANIPLDTTNETIYLDEFNMGSNGKQVIVSYKANIQVLTSATNAYHGFSQIGSSSSITFANNTQSMGFVFDPAGDTWYIRSANGAARTQTAIASIPVGVHTFRIEYDPANATPQVRFYIDGVLAGTITTNLSFGGGLYFGGGTGQDVIGTVWAPSIAVEI